MAGDLALTYFMLCQVVRLFNYFIVVALLLRSGPLYVHRPSFAIVAVEFALTYLLLLSNYHSCI